jgi:hypothetical protein
MKKCVYLISIFCLSPALFGCVWNIDQPPPEDWTQYVGNGATKEMIDLARFECGYPFPSAMFGYPENYASLARKYGYTLETEEGRKMLRHTHAVVDKCMKNQGFSHKGFDACRGWKDTLTDKYVPNDAPACASTTVIPIRSVNNRLNSRYCKEFPNAKACQP